MTQPEIKVLGVYKVEVTDEIIQNTFESKYEGIQLSEKQRREAEKAVRNELSSIALLDIIVNYPDEKFSMNDFKQPNSEQAPYDEAYLSNDGNAIVSRIRRPLGNSFRVVFFIHYLDASKPLITSYGEILLPEIQAMPKYIQNIMPYRPVD